MTLEEEMKVQEAFAFERGMEKGIEQGRSEGEKSGFSKGEKSGFSKGEKSGAAQEKREIARNLKSLKLPVEQIRTATGLSLAEIEAL